MTNNLSLERGLSVLEVLKDADDPVGVREIARRVGLSAPAVQRIVNTLAQRGYVEQAGGARGYRLGHAVLALAQHVMRHDRLMALADVELHALAGHSSLNAFLGVRRGTLGVYLMAVQSKSPVVIRAMPGETMPLHATALGKALLMGMREEEIAALFGDAPLERITARTLTTVEALVAQLGAARALGYTTALDENLIGIVSVGAPVRDASNAIVAAISVAYPRSVGPHLRISEVGHLVLEAAARISAGLGYERAEGPDRGPVHAA